MDVVVSGRHCEVSEEFKQQVLDKITRLEKHDQRLIRVEAKVEKQANREPERAIRVELTAKSRGPVVRAEAWAADKLAALDLALDRMEAQMRRARDRRKVHRGQHSPESVHAAMSRSEASWSEPEAGEEAVSERKVGPVTVTGDGPLVVREKTFPATPITAEQALYEMELVGHDFYLFVDKESDKPSVVYRRKGYDYGLISLDLS